MIKPFKIALFIAGINLLLLLIMFAVPKSGISISDDLKLSFVTTDDFLEDKKKEVAQIKEITQEYTLEQLENDTLVAMTIDSSLLDDKLLIKEENKIIHPSDFENGLYAFYKSLDEIKANKKLIRILHFGDSQIEGDRISGVVRDNLQSLFGGCGVGYLPISESNHGRRCVLKKTEGFDRWQMFGTQKNAPHNKYGFTGYYHRIANLPIDTTKNPSSAWIKLKPNKRYFKKAQNFEELSVLYGNSKEPLDYEIITDSGVVSRGNLTESKSVNKKTWQMMGFQEGNIKIALKGNSSPDIYGISMDCRTGVAVDNIALRGSSGTEFTKVDKDNLKAQLKNQNVGLIIYQFGVNVVPGNLKSYKYYERLMYKQLKLLKDILPNTSILVVGVSDMCRKEGSNFVTWPSIAKVRSAQMSAAQKAGCSFWDLYTVMGGENSMPSWVYAEPSLAEKDFTHFNARGAKVIGNKLFSSLIADYNDFKANEIQ